MPTTQANGRHVTHDVAAVDSRTRHLDLLDEPAGNPVELVRPGS